MTQKVIEYMHYCFREYVEKNNLLISDDIDYDNEFYKWIIDKIDFNKLRGVN